MLGVEELGYGRRGKEDKYQPEGCVHNQGADDEITLGTAVVYGPANTWSAVLGDKQQRPGYYNAGQDGQRR